MRLVSISYIRMFAMLSIITCHLMLFYDCKLSFLFNVGVQVFFLVSGYLYGLRKTATGFSKIVIMFRKIMIPYWVFIIPIIILYYIAGVGGMSISRTIGALLSVSTLPGIEHLWFVRFILCCYLLLPILERIREEGYTAIKLILGLIIINASLLVLPSSFSPWMISCFIIGFFWNDLKIFSSKNIGRGGVFTIVTIASQALHLFLLIHKDAYAEKFTVPIGGYCHLILGVYIFYMLLQYLPSTLRYNKILEFSDKYSYSIYVGHQFLLLSVFSLLTCIGNFYYAIPVALICIIALGVLIKYVSDFIEDRIKK